MARIPEAEIERLKEGVAVERLVATSGVELKKAGKEPVALLWLRDRWRADLPVGSTA